MSWYLKNTLDNPLIRSTRVRLARNVKFYSFPKFLSFQNARKLYEHLAEIFFSANENFRKDFRLFKIEELDEITHLSFVEKRLISKEFGHQKGAMLILSKDEKISIMLGEEDHIRIQVLSAGYTLWQNYAEAERIALIFEQGIEMAYDEKLGFLTSCPSNLGSGLRASVMLHLPFFSRKENFSNILKNIERYGFVLRGDHGEHSLATGHQFQLSNQITLGTSCLESLENLHKTVMFFLTEEVRLREVFLEKDREKIYNEVARSLALLKNAYLMSSKESYELLSSISLGLYYGFIQGSDENLKKLNQAFYFTGVASLQQLAGFLEDPLQRDKARAHYLRVWTKDLQFVPEMSEQGS